MQTRLCRYNLALYRLRDPARSTKAAIRALGLQLGLRDLDRNLCADGDSITSLETRAGAPRKAGYIPYSDRRLNWHTDGYYNDLNHAIRAFILHCVRPAAEGGASEFMDPDLAYILLSDEDPALTRALSAADAITIPANIENGRVLRPAISGPVFGVNPADGSLLMRYSARTRNIVWKDDGAIHAAAEFLRELLTHTSPYVFQHTLKAGEGVVSNNALHCRTAFHDPNGEPGRLLYRARYYNRSVGTEPTCRERESDHAVAE